MPNTQLGDTEQVAYYLSELDADSNPATPQPGDVITFVSSDTDSITIVPDATPQAGSVASGFLVGGKRVQVGVTVTATVTHLTGAPLTVVDTIDVVGGSANSITLGLGTPTAQAPPPPAGGPPTT
jgi:hypothetical protein